MPATKKRSAAKSASRPPAKAGGRRRSTPHSHAQQLEALERAERNVTLEFHEGAVTLTNLDKVLWPATASLPAYSRRDHMRYLLRMAGHMLPHVEHRPLTLIRQPEGVTG